VTKHGFAIPLYSEPVKIGNKIWLTIHGRRPEVVAKRTMNTKKALYHVM
jgi:hypothetical protein